MTKKKQVISNTSHCISCCVRNK